MNKIKPDSPSSVQGLGLVTLGLLGLGVVMVQSAAASVAQPGAWYARVDVRHTLFAIAAGIVLMTSWRLNFHWLSGPKSWPWISAAILAVTIMLGILVFVPGIGHSVGGFYRWIRIGPSKYQLGFQPSELIKLALVLFLSAWLSRPETNIRSFTR